MTVEKKTIKKFKWFWAWQDEAEEEWLGEMSKKGYHLASAGMPGIYEFDAGEPKDYVYRLATLPGRGVGTPGTNGLMAVFPQGSETG